jgi:hypothetical protein
MAGAAVEQRAHPAKRQPTGTMLTEAGVSANRALKRRRMEVGAGGHEAGAIERRGTRGAIERGGSTLALSRRVLHGPAP